MPRRRLGIAEEALEDGTLHPWHALVDRPSSIGRQQAPRQTVDERARKPRLGKREPAAIAIILRLECGCIEEVIEIGLAIRLCAS